MVKAIQPVKHDGEMYNEGDDLPELTEEQMATLIEAGAVEDPDAPDVEEEEVVEEDEVEG